tara:strand:+ start:3346 stop:3480 length:135 start_codon:yes stop_codon:yes gene_type:complete
MQRERERERERESNLIKEVRSFKYGIPYISKRNLRLIKPSKRNE